jgi:hypothetical protein
MQMSPDLMRSLLLVCMLTMVNLAVFYLRQRKLTHLAYIFWGLVAIMIPIIGPFVVIWMKPGEQQFQSQYQQTK